MMGHRSLVSFVFVLLLPSIVLANPLRVGVFDVDVSPPVGSPLAYDPCVSVAMSLRAKGVVFMIDDRPIVLCAVDWIGIANDSHRRWREAIANVVGTTPDRVSVHTLHQHDAPICDFSAETLLAHHGLSGQLFDVPFSRQVIGRVADGVAEAAANAVEVTHVGIGQGRVEKVASNRRILGDDGKVRVTRYTATRDPAIRAEPEGTIDPILKSISLWNGEQTVAVLTYYATHPQSYYRRGVANPDFPGIARFLRQVALNGIPHIHFNGAGGNIGAGKYNDGSADNRRILAQRVADGMSLAWQETSRHPVTLGDVSWMSTDVALQAAPHLRDEALSALVSDESGDGVARGNAARDLVWLRRCERGETVSVSCLKLGPALMLMLPGEAVVEYQLAAQEMRPQAFVAVAAYGDYGPGYICLQEHYEQGGYEASARASRVHPDTEADLMSAIRSVLPVE